MYGSRAELRQVFLRAWQRYQAQQPLEGAEGLIVAAALRHPEYQPLLASPEAQDRDYTPEAGAVNPFLHLGMHIAIDEQLSVDRPAGIRAHYDAIARRTGDEHEAQHAMMECLGEAIWRAQREGGAPDEQAYLACVARVSGLKPVLS